VASTACATSEAPAAKDEPAAGHESEFIEGLRTDDDWCDPEFDPSCGVAEGLSGGGSINVAFYLFDGISHQPGNLTLSVCSGGGINTTCGASLDNGYTVLCRITDLAHSLVTCAFTAPSAP